MENTDQSRKRRRLILLIGGILLGLLILCGLSKVMLLRAKAQGIAIGYAEAAVTAYQMDRYGRPMPDRMFETGPFRVDTRARGTPPVIEVYVKDRYFFFTYYSLTQTLELAGRPLPSASP